VVPDIQKHFELLKAWDFKSSGKYHEMYKKEKKRKEKKEVEPIKQERDSLLRCGMFLPRFVIIGVYFSWFLKSGF